MNIATRCKTAVAVLCAIIVSGSAFAQGRIVSARANDTIGCLDEATLLVVKQQSAGVVLPAGWQDRIAKLGCYAVAADLHWRVASSDDVAAHLQLSEPGVPASTSPVLYFALSDLSTSTK